ncbi:MAG: hypothetical protein KBD53_05610 [Candidatus Omnitrophica bacterium]|nr:hypothetical protein [Candidatus Omnitrophota bacterium]
MQEDEEIRRLKKLHKDTKDKEHFESDFDDLPLKAKPLKKKKKVNKEFYDEDEE